MISFFCLTHKKASCLVTSILQNIIKKETLLRGLEQREGEVMMTDDRFWVSYRFKRDERQKTRHMCVFYSAFASIKAFSIYLSERNIFTRFPHTPVQRVFARRRVNVFSSARSRFLND